jgi:hypothetical protein
VNETLRIELIRAAMNVIAAAGSPAKGDATGPRRRALEAASEFLARQFALDTRPADPAATDQGA